MKKEHAILFICALVSFAFTLFAAEPELVAPIFLEGAPAQLAAAAGVAAMPTAGGKPKKVKVVRYEITNPDYGSKMLVCYGEEGSVLGAYQYERSNKTVTIEDYYGKTVHHISLAWIVAGKGENFPFDMKGAQDDTPSGTKARKKKKKSTCCCVQ